MKTQSSYKNIAKTTGLIGGVQVIQMVFGLIRNKALALIVGAQGFGIWGLFNTYIEMLSQVALVGLDQSGARQIAKNATDRENVGKSIYVTTRAIVVIALVVTCISVVLSRFFSKTIIGTDDYIVAFIVISFAILFNSIFKCNSSILIGLGLVKALARSQIIGAISGSFISIAVVYLFRDKGIAICVMAVPFIAAITTGYFVRKVELKPIYPGLEETKRELSALISIGVAFSAAGIIATVMTYISRVYLTNTFNLETVGIYQASWTISNLYIGVILNAMGVDLMPRLMRVHDDNIAMNRLVNEQMELGLLIASLGVIGILAFSPLLLKLLYSGDFVQGSSIIQWQVLGVSLRVLAFPFSYAIMAKARSLIFVSIQFVFWIMEFLLLVLFSNLFGFDGLGINYPLGYIIYFTLTLWACKRLFSFRFSPLLLKILARSYTSIAITFVMSFSISPRYSIPLGLVVLAVQMLLVNSQLKENMGINLVAILKCQLRGGFS